MKIKDKFKNVIRKTINNTTRDINSIKEMSYDEMIETLKNNSEVAIVDVRSPQEFAEGRIKYSINIPLYELNKKADSMLLDKNKLIILYCQCGVRSKKACKILEEKGYKNVYSLKGGIDIF